MKKIAILVDSFSGIKNGQYKDVYVIPMVISETVDKQTYTFKDGIDIDNKQISLKMINGSIIKTASSIPGDIVQLIERISSQYDEIYCFPIPQCISGSYNSWVMALEICDLKKTHLFKQNLACACLEWMVQDFLLANSKGLLNVEYVQKHLDYIKDKCAVGVILPELKYAIMGGRISKFKGLVASVLKILTVVCFDGISLHKFDTAFSAKKIVEILCKDMIEKKFPNKKIKRIGLFINELHEDKFDDQKFSVLIKNQFKKYKISSYLLPSVIMVHAGPNYIGIAVEVE